MYQYKGSESVTRTRELPKILVVEDNPDHSVIIRKAMLVCFNEVEPVLTTSPDETISYLTKPSDQVMPPRFILMDLYLPRREDGWQLIKQIKALDSPFDKLPIVVLSHSNDLQDIAESYRQGSNSYLVKPTHYQEWIQYFQVLKEYWWETVTLPNFPLYQ